VSIACSCQRFLDYLPKHVKYITYTFFTNFKMLFALQINNEKCCLLGCGASIFVIDTFLRNVYLHNISTRRHIPEDGILHSHRRENLKSYRSIIMMGDAHVRTNDVPLIPSTALFFSFGASAPICTLAYLHETLCFTSVY
jgi:hypothetical protein